MASYFTIGMILSSLIRIICSLKGLTLAALMVHVATMAHQAPVALFPVLVTHCFQHHLANLFQVAQFPVPVADFIQPEWLH